MQSKKKLSESRGMSERDNGSPQKEGTAAARNLVPEPIAIIGIGCRYPDISGPAELWQTLMAGREVVGPYPGGRFADLDRLYEEARRQPGRILTDRGGFLSTIDGFDAQFFEISPREAVYIDPQHRLLLEVAWEALEDAGQVRKTYEGSATGVYAGLWTNEYENRLYESGSDSNFYSVTGCGRASASGRVSFALGLEGPSITVDTACSSSLVAVHMACQALWAEEVSMALAGGANLILGQEIPQLFTQAQMLSPEGRCKFGDASANGFVRSEGAAMVVLKRLSRALTDNDPIYALIRGSVVNNDGRTSGFLVPSRQGQRQMLRAAWKSAGVEAKDIRYIEMHGTGTGVGDPIEIGSVGSALAESGATRACVIGSIKTNLGHTESASGVTGLIKAALALHHRTIPPSLHFQVPNPKVPWSQIPVRVATESVDLSAEAAPLLAGVNSFGLSGTNAHVVLEAAAERAASAAHPRGPYLLPLSARTPEALQGLLRGHLAVLEAGGEEYPLRDVCYTASVRRTHHEHRAAIVAGDLEEMKNNLAAAIASQECDGVFFDRAGAAESKIAFVAPGQGSQWPGMARELFEQDTVFRHAFEQCDAAIAAETGWSLVDRVLGPEVERSLSQIDVIQPALFAMSVALAAVWRSWGIEPDVVIGHSMGEVAAAHIAGILTLTDAAAVICRRSRLMKTLTSAGSMASVELPLAEVEALLSPGGDVSVAASNGPHTTVISGDTCAVERLLRTFEVKEIYCRLIKVDVASHSAQVDPILDQLFRDLSGIRPNPAKIPMLSTVTGKYASGSRDGETGMDAAYWVENLRRSVLFAPAIEKLAGDENHIFIELSPHPILLPSIEASAREASERARAVGSLRREKPERAVLLRGLAALYAAGNKIAWDTFYPAAEVRCVTLPQYPFQRERFWPEPGDPARTRRIAQASPLLGHKFESSLQPSTLLWESELDLAELPYLGDHRVLGSAVFPASGHIVMALSGAAAGRPGQSFEVRAAQFLSAAYLPDQGSKRFQLALTPEGDGLFRFELRGHADKADSDAGSKDDPAWVLYSSGLLTAVPENSAEICALSIDELKQRCPVHRTAEELYERTTRSGLNYGPAFQLVEEAWVGARESLCRLRSDLKDAGDYVIHPALLDACFQAMAHIRPEQDAFKAEDTYLPVVIDKIRIHGAIPRAGDLFAQAVLVASDAAEGALRADLRLLDAQGKLLVDIRGLRLMRVARESLAGAVEPLYSLQWIDEKVHEKGRERAEASLALIPKLSAENWVVFADDTGVAATMKVSLVSVGGRCTTVRPGTHFRKIADGEFEIDPGSRKDLDRLFEEVAHGIGVPTAVLHLWTLDNNSTEPYDAARLIRSQALGCQHVALVVQAIAAANWQSPPRLWLITAGVMAVGDDQTPARIENAPMWGMGRAVVREHAELRTTLADLSFIPDPREARALVLEVFSQRKEDRIALRGAAKYIARLVHFSSAAPETKAHRLGDREDYRLEIFSTGILDNIELRLCEAPIPRPGEITIEVIAAGLNFIDVTKVMGIYPGLDPAQPIQLGIECAGRVISVGAGVEAFQIGDEVMAITPSMRSTALMASSVRVPAAMAFRKPPALSFEEAATTPIAFLTACYSLIELARIRRGDWVLVHAAAGGVGLAAIEIAKWAGAKVIATAGSREKVEYLRSLGLTHIFNSRSLDFVSGVMDATDGRGVDILLNSLTGEFIPSGLEVLASYGRFIELGKKDIYEDRSVGLKVFRKNISFHAVDLAAAFEEKPDSIVELMAQVMRRIESGEWRPLPVTSFSSAEPSAPFRFMAQARHIGKISIRMDRDVEVLPASDRKLFSANATYLITGGLGGVALTVAEWMAENGAGHLVLLSRRAPSAESAAAILRMEGCGTAVTALCGDVTREEDLKRVMHTIHATLPPLKGIMHTAAVVDDALILDVTPERFLPVMAPKITGAWNLHMATLEEKLDFFVLYSSIAALHPQPGMASYAAANAFLDSFAYFLRAQGRPAISINWGGWDQIGLARAEGTGRSIEVYLSEGMRIFSAGEALEALRGALETRPVQVVAVPIDTERMMEFYGQNGVPPAFADLISESRLETATRPGRSEILDQLDVAAAAPARQEIFEGYLQDVLGRVLKLAANRIDRERLFGSMGLDSLMGLEFVRRLSNALEIAVPATVVFNYPTIQLLAAHLLRRMHIEPSEEIAPEKSSNPRASNTHETTLGDLSEEDALQTLIGSGPRNS